MATNVANQPIPRHPISERNRTFAVRGVSPTAAGRHAGFRPGHPRLKRSEDADARRAPGMTISI
jgi:hypothetical protein